MKLTDLNNGDRITFDGDTRTVKHVSLHPSGTRVIFYAESGKPDSLPAWQINADGWTLVARRISETTSA